MIHQTLVKWCKRSLLIACFAILVGCSQQTARSQAQDAYVFPIQPGTEEWKKLFSREAMLAATQIPEPVLEAMSTPGLVQTVLSYPLFIDVHVYSSLQGGVDALRRDFNGINALLKRPDAATMLLGRYQMLDAVALSDTLQVAYIELLLAQPEIIAQFTPPEQRELLTTMLQHHEQREQLIDTYSMTTFQTSTLLVGRMLHHNAVFNPIDPRVEQFLRDTTYDDEYDLRAVSHIVFDEAACQIATLK